MTLTYPHFNFSVTHTTPQSAARRGMLQTPHGTVETPAFIFCATKAAIKGLCPQAMEAAHTQIILANTYHLMLQPGSELVAEMGGLHTFMGWNKPMLTDSGGYQIFSLGHGSVASEIKGHRTGQRPPTLRRITEEGAWFQSYVNGTTILLTPERAMEIQRQLGADLVVMLDECTPFHVDKSYTARSMALSHRWGLRSLAAFDRTHDGKQAVYGIVQGGVYPDLRQAGADFVNQHPFFGHAIGGSLGASKAQMHEIVAMTMAMLSPERPVHLLGIGGVSDIFNGVRAGIDTFDCVHPTRISRHGGALVSADFWEREGMDPEQRAANREHINLRNSRFRHDSRPIDPACGCSTCTRFSRAYLHHLIKAQEILAIQALTTHNVYYMNRLFTEIRDAIATHQLDACEKRWVVS